MTSLQGADRPLAEVYDVALFDLDGVVYLGPSAVPGAPEHMAELRSRSVRILYVTNNASRPPEAVVEHLDRLGIPSVVEDVVTSAQAAAGMVAERVPKGSSVLVVGGEGLNVALRERGLVPVAKATDAPVAVVQGFHPDLSWRQLAEGAYALATGIPWVASNADLTLPTEGGVAPGNGALIETLRIATGRSPMVAGKPEPPLFFEALARSGGSRPLVVGDRLDTDIEGANASDMPSLLVLTGVTDLALLVTAPEKQRPTYVSADLGGLFVAHPAPSVEGSVARCGGWEAAVEDKAVRLSGSGDRMDGARALLAAAWSVPEPADLDVAAALAQLG